MCYFLYGSINKGIKIHDYKKLLKKSDYHFNIGSKDDVNISVLNGDFDYRITSNHCDCGTSIGSECPDDKELKKFADLLKRLRSVGGIKYITISKNWAEESNEKEVKVHIDDIDVINFLANIEERTLYIIELYKKSY